jgi:dihydrofolate synthase/folylpolyglutamate synthase
MLTQRDLDRYHHAVAYLESIPKLPQPDYELTTEKRTLFLKRFSYLINRLGNPQNDFKIVHVGGTSGKGSTATMMQCILTDAGLNVGLFTSPYASSPTEKFRVGDKLISAKEFADVVDELKPALDYCDQHSPYGRPSLFEITTALALVYFKHQRCTHVVLEVGCGGRFDATNIIPAPEVAILTTISYDHMHILGSTLTAIAGEKAGIIKRGSHIITGHNTPAVVKIFRDTAKKVGASFEQVLPTEHFSLKLLGEHQQRNAALAAAAAAHLGISSRAIRSGLRRATLACRFEIIQQKPLVVLDGAHNPEKLASTEKLLAELTYQKLYLIIAMTHERLPRELFKTLAQKADRIACTRYLDGGKRPYPPAQLAAQIRRYAPKTPIDSYLDPADALADFQRRTQSKDLILSTGSFYLSGALRKMWVPETKILSQRHI